MATLASSTRFISAGVTKWYFLTALAATNLTPTRAEITAGTDISGEVADFSGWTLQASSVATPDQGSRFIKNVPGRTSVADSSITFYADKGGTDIRGTMTLDLAGWIVIADGGDVTGYKAEVFPVRVMSVGGVRSTGDAAFQITVQYAITSTPATITLPATA